MATTTTASGVMWSTQTARSACAWPAASSTSGVSRTHARTPVLLRVHDLDVRLVNAATGELLRALTIDPSKSYQPIGAPPGPRRPQPPA